MNVLCIRYNNSHPIDRIRLLQVMGNTKIKMEWKENINLIKIYWELNQEASFKELIFDLKNFVTDVDIFVKMNAGPEILYADTDGFFEKTEKHSELKFSSSTTVEKISNGIEEKTVVEVAPIPIGTTLNEKVEDTASVEAVTTSVGVSINEKSKDAEIGEPTTSTEPGLNGKTKDTASVETAITSVEISVNEKSEDVETSEHITSTEPGINVKAEDAKTGKPSASVEAILDDGVKNPATEETSKLIETIRDEEEKRSSEISDETYEKDLRVLLEPYLKKYDLKREDTMIANDFCEELKLSGKLMFGIVMLTYPVRDEAEMYSVLSRALEKNVAQVKVAAKMTFGRWINKEYPEFVKAHPGIKLNHFLNVLRDGKERF